MAGGIVIFTIIVRTLILPITVRSIKSMKSMQDIQPKLKELQKKHKGDRMKIQQETMALYQTYHINPLAGVCRRSSRFRSFSACTGRSWSVQERYRGLAWRFPVAG